MIVGDGKTAILCPSLVADIDIEFQDMIHDGGKVSVLYREVAKNLSKRSNALKSKFHIFTPLQANKFQWS